MWKIVPRSSGILRSGMIFHAVDRAAIAFEDACAVGQLEKGSAIFVSALTGPSLPEWG